jgi:hypothetical protein
MAYDRRKAQRRKSKKSKRPETDRLPDRRLDPMEQADLRHKFETRLKAFRETNPSIQD